MGQKDVMAVIVSLSHKIVIDLNGLMTIDELDEFEYSVRLDDDREHFVLKLMMKPCGPLAHKTLSIAYRVALVELCKIVEHPIKLDWTAWAAARHLTAAWRHEEHLRGEISKAYENRN